VRPFTNRVFMNNEKAIQQFQVDWQNRGYEKGESQQFWLDLLANVFGIQDLAHFIQFENQVHLDHTSFIDGYIPSTKVLIEQKGREKDLNKPIQQSDGSYLTAFQQAKRYAAELPYSQRPRWIVTCNFRSWCIYDMEQPNSEPQTVLLENLHKESYRLQFLVQQENIHLNREMEMSMKAGEIIGHIYDKLLALYINPDAPETLHSLNMLCVRLVFCLYAEDAGIFGRKQLFGDYISQFPAKQIRQALLALFEVLDTPIDKRDPYLDEDLKAFPYVNGGLFTVQDKQIPQFTDELKQMIVRKASDDFDWSEISPTIFGAIFESTLNPETRRAGGMHYTSIENIHKVIDPLFLNDLTAELEQLLALPIKQQKTALVAYQKRLASLRFLDPACGSGNFLTETFISLRRLENRCLQALQKNQITMDFFDDRVKVSIQQFYGIEINDFAATVAKTALWIAESQMLHETCRILQRDIDFLPLQSYSNIVEGNALQIDWATLSAVATPYPSKGGATPSPLERAGVRPEPPSPLERVGVRPAPYNYIMGNPPFVGARLMSKEQKEDLLPIFKGCKNIGNLDYVGGWYMKAAQLMQANHTIRAALVSTNSIAQGEQPAILWNALYGENMHIDFAYRTFRWDSEATLKAHVHCVIIGFSGGEEKSKFVFNESGVRETVKNINPYLINSSNTIIESRSTPLCDVPEIGIGNKPIDDGNYLFKPDEMAAFIAKEPKSEKYFRPWYGADEFINNRPRYCLWLGDCSPAELRSMPECLKRVENVRTFRLQSKSEGTRKLADRPTRFHVENMPTSEYIIIPRVSSERRRYIPMGYLQPNCLTSDSAHIIPNATLYHFGVLTSNVHMAWMRAVCGRLEMRYRYSKDIVYNNFPWPTPTAEQQAEIMRTAQAILDARAQYLSPSPLERAGERPETPSPLERAGVRSERPCSLADLYDEVTMPIVLRRAHQANDRAVMRAYGFPTTLSESDCVARLFERYEEIIDN